MPPVDELLTYLFEGNKTAFTPEFENWVRGSRRFREFAIRYRSKIRSKLKSARDEAGLKDIRAELETAWLLLHEERFTLEYERYTALRQRGPDFTVTFKTHTPLNIEVRRMRSVELDDKADDGRFGKLMAVVCDKVGQMPPSIVNLVWLTTERALSADDVTRTMIVLRQRAEQKTEDYFTRRGFKNATDFLRQYHQLSGIVLRQAGEHTVWLNSLAKHKTPPDVVTAIQRLGKE
ncbi:MAG: hypothetical protein SF029_08515 [bacterium]|nr:hypothetical protein [bacterium]